jgi:hypothetical protein
MTHLSLRLPSSDPIEVENGAIMRTYSRKPLQGEALYKFNGYFTHRGRERCEGGATCTTAKRRLRSLPSRGGAGSKAHSPRIFWNMAALFPELTLRGAQFAACHPVTATASDPTTRKGHIEP